MPFKKGNQSAKGIGRKGFDLEQKQYKEMLAIWGEHMKMAKKIQQGKATDKEIEAFKITDPSNKSIIGKLHPEKRSVEHSGEIFETNEVILSPETQDMIKKIIEIEEAK